MICKLSDIMEIIGGGTPKTTNPEYWNGPIPWISVKDFNGERRYVGRTEKSITEKGLTHSSTKLLKNGDLIISARGTVGELAIIPSAMAFNQSCYGLRAKDNVESMFLYYLLLNNMNILKHHTHGSVFDTITRDTFESIEIDLPDMDKQKRIAGILSAIDDKIELNTAINENLEQQAQAIYTKIFVTDKCNSDREGHLSELITIKYGKDHKKLNNGIYPAYGSGGIIRYVERPLYDKESVLIPRKGSLNNIMYVNKPFWSVDTMFYTEMKQPNIAKFVFHFIKSKDLVSLNTGSAVPSMTTDILNSMELIIPSADKLAEFDNIVTPLYQAIADNIQQSANLSAIRDILLPKLMNGEIDVSRVEA